MLGCTKTERASVEATEFEWLDLSNIERRLIDMYRLLTEEDRKQLRRLTEALVTTQDELAAS